VKRLLTILSILIISFNSFGQTRASTSGFSPRANQTFVVEDGNLSARNALFIPRYTDTTQANTFILKDTLGAVIFNYATMSLWVRSGSPKTWVEIGSGGGISDGDKGDITVSGSGATWTIDNSAVTYAKMQNVSATNTFLGRSSSGAGVVEELTTANATGILDVFTDVLQGVVPGSGGGTTNFLRADGTWAVAGGAGNLIIQNAGSGQQTWYTSGDSLYMKMHKNTSTISWASDTDSSLLGTVIDGSITYAKIQNLTQARLLGRYTASTGSAQEISIGTGLALDAGTGILSSTITSGVSSMGAIGATPNANGATITGTTLNLEPASISFGGVVTAGSQTFLGPKFIGTDSYGGTDAGSLQTTSTVVVGSSASSEQLIITNSNSTTNTSGLGFRNNAGTSYGLLRTFNSSSAVTIAGIAFASGFAMTAVQSGVPIALSGNNAPIYISPNTTTPVITAISAGRVGLNAITAPTAWLHLPAGGTAASGAPLKFTSGTNMTTPEAGSVEFDGTNYFATSSTTRYTLAKTLTATATLDFASTGSGAVADLTITVTGAADGDDVVIGVPNGSVTATATYTGWVSAANTVTIRFSPKATEDPASGTFRASIIKY